MHADQHDRESDRMNLAELVQSRRGDRSYGKLSDASGGTPKPARWSQLGTPGGMGTNALDPATVRGVARALYVPTRAVWLAVGESLGLDVWRTDDDLPAMFPPGLPVLKQRHWDVLLPLMQMLVEDAEREDQLTAIAAAAEEPAEETKPARRPTRRTRAAKES